MKDKSAKKRNFLQKLVTGVAVCAVVMLAGATAMSYIDPEHFPWAGLICLTYPFFLFLICVAWLLTLLFAPRQAWIPIVGILLCFGTIRDYMPLNIPSTPPEGSLKILTYNTAGFGGSQKDENGKNPVLEYIKSSNADIVCLQEALDIPANRFADEVIPALQENLPYHDTLQYDGSNLACFSRYPIISKQIICKKENNGSGAFRMVLSPGDTVCVVNCHLESMHLTSTERKHYEDLVHNPEKAKDDANSRSILKKLMEHTVIRTQQTKETVAYIQSQPDKSVIVCGDLNDTPVSYTHRCFTRAGLQDAYTRAGRFVGRSFNRDAIYVRIDHIFCSKNFRAYSSYVDRSAKGSDHYPLVTYLYPNEKPEK